MPYKQQQGKPRVILFSDGRHAAGLDCFEPPITKAELLKGGALSLISGTIMFGPGRLAH